MSLDSEPIMPQGDFEDAEVAPESEWDMMKEGDPKLQEGKMVDIFVPNTRKRFREKLVKVVRESMKDKNYVHQGANLHFQATNSDNERFLAVQTLFEARGYTHIVDHGIVYRCKLSDSDES